jgi:predicted O-methyltransferase YrrM
VPRQLLAHVRYAAGVNRQVWTLARSLRNAAAGAGTPAGVIDAAFATADDPISIQPLQVRSELEDFLALVKAEEPRRILEIGTGTGGTLYLLAWASHPAARVLSLDRRIYPVARRRLYRTFTPRPRQVDAMEADSRSDATRSRVEEFFGGRPLDLLFIDGGHGYESVRRDYELYGPLLRDRGLVAFHDIVEGPPEVVGDVPRYWREVRASLLEPLEFVESRRQGGAGIGVGRRPTG